MSRALEIVRFMMMNLVNCEVVDDEDDGDHDIADNYVDFDRENVGMH